MPMKDKEYMRNWYQENKFLSIKLLQNEIASVACYVQTVIARNTIGRKKKSEQTLLKFHKIVVAEE